MRRAAPAGVRCTATTPDGQCRLAYIAGERPILCGRHHAVLRRSLAAFGAPPATWTELRPRDWKPSAATDTLCYLADADGEPLAFSGGRLYGVDSGLAVAEAVVLEGAGMGWLRLLAHDREDVRAAFRIAYGLAAGERWRP